MVNVSEGSAFLLPAISQRLRRRLILEWWAVALAVAILAATCCMQNWLWRTDLILYDLMHWNASVMDSSDVVIVEIDDVSLDRLGAWPWKRTLYAGAINRLTAAGCRAIGLDVLLRDAQPDDDVLARAIWANGAVVLPLGQTVRDGQIMANALPSPALLQAAADIGHAEVILDPDGIARSSYLWGGYAQATYPQFAFALLKQVNPALVQNYLRKPQAQAESSAWQRVQSLRIPIDGKRTKVAHYSYADVLDGTIPSAAFFNKIVLIGVTARSITDALLLPGRTFQRNIPGVEFQANMLTAVRNGNVVRVLPSPINAFVAAMTGVLLLMMLGRLSERTGLAWVMGVVVFVGLLSWLMLAQAGWWYAPASTWFGCMLAYPLWYWRRMAVFHDESDAQAALLNREHLQRESVWSREVIGLAQLAHMHAGDRLGVEMGGLVREAADWVQPLFPNKTLRLGDGANAQTVGMVQGDAQLLRWTVCRTLLYAIGHSPAQSTLEINLQREGGYWNLTVSTQGLDIPAEHIEMSLNPGLAALFYQSLPADRANLMAVQTILRHFGGRLSASTQDRAQTELRLSFAVDPSVQR